MKDLDDKIGWVCLSSLRNRAEFTGELGDTILLEPPKGAIAAKQLLVISLGDEKACRLAKTCRKNSGRRASVTPTRLARGETVTHGPCDRFLYDRMAQRPPVLVNLFFVLLGVLDVESGLKPSKRGLTRIVSSTSSRISRFRK
jgi:hypothetical protein